MDNKDTEIAALRAQRDELAALLRALLDANAARIHANLNGGGPSGHPINESVSEYDAKLAARAALAKVEGK